MSKQDICTRLKEAASNISNSGLPRQYRVVIGEAFNEAVVEIERLTKERDQLLEALTELTEDIQGLIADSSGVYGLHLNGDLAPWSELEAGGQFEVLIHLPVAEEVIASVKGSK